MLARNWRVREGEIDLIARRDRTIVFCEVKTRRGDAFGTPAEAVTPRKQARMRKLAVRWLAENAARADVLRFDVASVTARRTRRVGRRRARSRVLSPGTASLTLARL